MESTLKVVFSELSEVHLLSLPLDATYQQLIESILSRFPIPELEEFRLFYIDAEDDYVIISSTEELVHARKNSSCRPTFYILLNSPGALPETHSESSSSSSSALKQTLFEIGASETKRKHDIVRQYRMSKAQVPSGCNPPKSGTPSVSPLFSGFCSTLPLFSSSSSFKPCSCGSAPRASDFSDHSEKSVPNASADSSSSSSSAKQTETNEKTEKTGESDESRGRSRNEGGGSRCGWGVCAPWGVWRRAMGEMPVWGWRGCACRGGCECESEGESGCGASDDDDIDEAEVMFAIQESLSEERERKREEEGDKEREADRGETHTPHETSSSENTN